MLFQNILISSIILAIKSDAEFDACKQNPCMNGATCLSQSQFSYKCLCPLGFEGKNCTKTETFSNSEEDSNESQQSEYQKCLNGGKFVKDGLPCSCPDGYRGSKCEIYPPNKICTANTCLNNGTCHTIKKNFKCQCHGYYDGSRCQFLKSYGYNRRTTGISSFSSLLMIIGLIALIVYCFCFKQKRNDTGLFPQGTNGFSGVFLRPGGVSFPYPQSPYFSQNPTSSNFNYPTFVNTPHRLPQSQIPEPEEANRVNQAPPSYEEVQKMKKSNV